MRWCDCLYTHVRSAGSGRTATGVRWSRIGLPRLQSPHANYCCKGTPIRHNPAHIASWSTCMVSLQRRGKHIVCEGTGRRGPCGCLPGRPCGCRSCPLPRVGMGVRCPAPSTNAMFFIQQYMRIGTRKLPVFAKVCQFDKRSGLLNANKPLQFFASPRLIWKRYTHYHRMSGMSDTLPHSTLPMIGAPRHCRVDATRRR